MTMEFLQGEWYVLSDISLVKVRSQMTPRMIVYIGLGRLLTVTCKRCSLGHGHRSKAIRKLNEAVLEVYEFILVGNTEFLVQ